MNTLGKPSPLNAQIYEEASNWFVDLRAGDVDAAGQRQFDAWMRKSPEHLRAYLEITEIWEDAPFADAAKEAGADSLIARARTEKNIVPLGVSSSTPLPPGEGSGVRDSSLQRLAIAASLLITLALTAAFAWRQSHSPSFTTDIGEQRTLTLADGSIVELNARSKIRVRFSEDERRIDLVQGQALFHVAKNSTKPFIVNIDGAKVRAVGTRFDIYRRKTTTTVTVLEGRVAVSSSSILPSARPRGEGLGEVGSSLLNAGEQLTIDSYTPTKPIRTNVAAATAWTQRQLVFDSSRLADVVDEFNRYNRRQLAIRDEQLADIHISGVYSSTDPALLLRFLREQRGIEVDESGPQILIVSK